MGLFDTLWQGAQGVAALPINALTDDLRGWDRQIFPSAPVQAAVGQGGGLTQPAAQPTPQPAAATPSSQFIRGPFMRAAADLGQAITDPVAAARATSPPGSLPGTPAQPPASSARFEPAQAPSLNLSPAPRGGPGVAPAPAVSAYQPAAAQPTAQPAAFTLPVLTPQQALQQPPGTHFVSTDARVLRRT